MERQEGIPLRRGQQQHRCGRLHPDGVVQLSPGGLRLLPVLRGRRLHLLQIRVQLLPRVSDLRGCAGGAGLGWIVLGSGVVGEVGLWFSSLGSVVVLCGLGCSVGVELCM